MRAEIIARNYAETLLALAERHGGAATAQEFGTAADELALLLEREPRVREFLETPRLGLETKKEALRGALSGRVPELFLRFVMVVLDKRRQTLLRAIAAAYRGLLDERQGRVRVQVRIAHEPDAALQEEIRASLASRLGKDVLPAFSVEPELLGGMVVRVGDEVLDASVRSRLTGLRRALLEVQIPETAGV